MTKVLNPALIDEQPLAVDTTHWSCGRCAFWREDGPSRYGLDELKAKSNYGECRRRPPLEGASNWPRTYSTELCGEFRPAVAPF